MCSSQSRKSRRTSSRFTALALSAGSLLIALGVSPSWAECAAGFCSDVYVEQLYTYPGNSHFWLRTTGTETLLNCTPDSGVFLQVPASSKELFALLLAAQMADKVVLVRVVEGSNPCAVSWVSLNR
jgi:hypothetical protein